VFRLALRQLARVAAWALMPLLAGCSAGMIRINPPDTETATVDVTVVVAGTSDPLTVEATVVVGGEQATLAAGEAAVRVPGVPYGTADPPRQPLTVNAPGFATHFENLELKATGVTDVQVEMEAADPDLTGTITGNVNDSETGDPIANAVLDFRPDIPGDPEGVQAGTNKAGAYTVRGVLTGATVVEATATGYLTGEQSVVVIQDSGGGNADPLDFDLVPTSAKTTVNGQVLDLIRRDPVAGATVSLGGVGPETTGADGRFTLPDVPVGDQPLQVMADKYDTVNTTVSVVPGMPDLTIELAPIEDQPPPGPATIRGTVTINNNPGNAGATVKAIRTADAQVIDTDVTNVEGDYGLFVPPGRYRIEVSFKGVTVSRTVTLEGFGRVLTGVDFQITAP